MASHSLFSMDLREGMPLLRNLNRKEVIITIKVWNLHACNVCLLKGGSMSWLKEDKFQGKKITHCLV